MRASVLLLGAALVLSSADAGAQQPAQPGAPAQQPAQPSAQPPTNTPPAPPQAPPGAVPYPYPYAAPSPPPYGAPYPGLAPNAPKYRNNGMRIAGIVITSVASALLFTGIVCSALPNSGGVSLAVGLPQIGTSAIVAAVGVPLWVSGAKPPEIAPGVAIGPGSLRIAF